MKPTIFGLLVLVAACAPKHYGATGTVGGMPPSMPAGANLPLWEYFCGYPPGDLAAYLGQAGEQGWELITTDGGHYCFKRPHAVPAPPATPPPANPPSS